MIQSAQYIAGTENDILLIVTILIEPLLGEIWTLNFTQKLNSQKLCTVIGQNEHLECNFQYTMPKQ